MRLFLHKIQLAFNTKRSGSQKSHMNQEASDLVIASGSQQIKKEKQHEIVEIKVGHGQKSRRTQVRPVLRQQRFLLGDLFYTSYVQKVQPQKLNLWMWKKDLQLVQECQKKKKKTHQVLIIEMVEQMCSESQRWYKEKQRNNIGMLQFHPRWSSYYWT